MRQKPSGKKKGGEASNSTPHFIQRLFKDSADEIVTPVENMAPDYVDKRAKVDNAEESQTPFETKKLVGSAILRCMRLQNRPVEVVKWCADPQLGFSGGEDLFQPLVMSKPLLHLVDMSDRHRGPDKEPRRLPNHDFPLLPTWPHAAVLDLEVGMSAIDLVKHVVEKLPYIFIRCA